ncbi:MAG TPA: hypothetical protein VFO16_01785 [Pseudonocardiaceae bacterium]|nr:hypothetical protein [Pseudonocardiaceae bacterium]
MSSTSKVANSPLSAHQLTYGRLREVLRSTMRVATESEPGSEVSAVGSRASAALDALLAAHPVDKRSRCSSCRAPSAIFAVRRSRCRVLLQASFWLLQPYRFLQAHVFHQ